MGEKGESGEKKPIEKEKTGKDGGRKKSIKLGQNFFRYTDIRTEMKRTPKRRSRDKT